MKRYQQQLFLPEIGLLGQAKLTNARVLVVGAGGLGTIVAGYLAAIGIGQLGIADFDTVDESNLHRQILYSEDDIGQKKSQILSAKLKKQNSNIIITAIDERITINNAQALLDNYQIVCDCSDNVDTRLALDHLCGVLDMPLVHGAVSDWQGYISVFHYKKKFTYAHLFDKDNLLNAQTCAANGISSPLCGIIGSYMVVEAQKVILDLESNLEGNLLYINALTNVSRYIKLKKGVFF
jgi:sulfur-carrier protein adenylyltransferase/sulfurtransferase